MTMLTYEEASKLWAAKRLGIDVATIKSVEFNMETEAECSTFDEWSVPYVEATVRLHRVGPKIIHIGQYDLTEVLRELFAVGEEPLR